MPWLRTSGRGGWLLAGAGALAAAVGVYLYSRRSGEEEESEEEEAPVLPPATRRPATPTPAADVVPVMPRVVEDRAEVVAAPIVQVAEQPLARRPYDAALNVVEECFQALAGFAVLGVLLFLALVVITPNSHPEFHTVASRVLWCALGAVVYQHRIYLARHLVGTEQSSRSKDVIEFEPKGAGAPAARPFMRVADVTPAAKDTSGAAAGASGAAAGTSGAAAGAGGAPPSAFAAVDELLEANDLDAAQAQLEPRVDDEDPSTAAAALWRMARLYNTLSTQAKERDNNPDRARELAVAAHGFAKRSLDKEPTSGGHKWMSILIAKVAKDTKEKIKNAFKIRDHATTAVELDPEDPMPHHILGEWAYSVAGIGWIERKAAALLFATPPQATYDEALAYYLAAENLKPGFYLTNRIRIVETLLALKRKSEARKWMAKVDELPPSIHDGRRIKDQIKALRAKL